MSLNENYPPVDEYVGDGSTTVFPYTFKITHKNYIMVDINDIVLTVDTDYTVSSVGTGSGGNVTLLVAPILDAVIRFRRDTPFDQLTTFTNYDSFPASVVEAAFDKLTAIAQELMATFGEKVAERRVKWDATSHYLEPEDTSIFEIFRDVDVALDDNFEDFLFETEAENTDYVVQVTPNWNTAWWIPDAQKETTGFRVRFATAATESAMVSVIVYA